MHRAIPITPVSRQSPQADPAILSTERSPRKARPLAYRGKQQVPKSAAEEQAEAEAALAEALRLSLEGAGVGAALDGQGSIGEGADEEDLLAQAIALSMQQDDAPFVANSTTSTAPARAKAAP